MQAPGGSGRCRSKDHVHAGDTHNQVRPDNSIDQVYTMEHKTLPHPTIIKKMKTFLEVEGKVQYQLANSCPHYQIPNPTLGRTMLWKREKGSA